MCKEIQEFYPLGYNTVLTDVSEEHVASIFRVEEQAEQEYGIKVASAALLGFLLDPEDGSNMFLQNVG
jgi:hypothetical protein